MLKKVLLIVIVLVAVASIIAYMQYNKPHKDIAASEIDFESTLLSLFDEFENNPVESSKKYTDKIVVVTAEFYKLANSESKTTVLMKDTNGRIANCEMLTSAESYPNEGEEIKIKGLFVGYDDLLGEIVFKKCTIQE